MTGELGWLCGSFLSVQGLRVDVGPLRPPRLGTLAHVSLLHRLLQNHRRIILNILFLAPRMVYRARKLNNTLVTNMWLTLSDELTIRRRSLDHVSSPVNCVTCS